MSRVENINCGSLILGGNKQNGNIDITSRDSNSKIFINGIEPGAGGSGGSPPISGVGDITITGNIRANGDGVSTGKIEGEIIKATTGNIIATAGNVEVLAGNVEISGTGGLEINGTGNINLLGSGNLGVGTGGITSIGNISVTTGDLETNTGDIVSANNIYFEGSDIFNRSETGGVITNTSYKNFKQLVGLNDNNTFTGANKFDDNITEFSEKVSVGTRDPVTELFTQNLALNKSGNLESKTINNTTTITCGNVNCDNGGTNSVAARVFTTRTSGLAGWSIEQQTAVGNPADNVLQVKAGQTGAYVGFTDTTYTGITPPNVVIDPRTTALGGLIAATTHQVGQGITSFKLEQPTTGADTESLLVNCGSNEGAVKFQNNAGTIDLARIERDSVDNSGRIYCPAIFFGTTGLHNSIVNDISGPDSLNLRIRQATASSEVLFEDNNAAELLRIRKTQMELATNYPILFNNFSFRPQQYTFNFSGAVIDDNPAVIFNSGTALWTNINDGGTSTLATIGNNFFKMTIIGVPDNSAGVYGNFRWSGDFPFVSPSFSVGTVINRYDGNFSIVDSPSGFTKPDLCGFSSGSTDYKLCFPSVTAGTETYTGIIRITILNT